MNNHLLRMLSGPDNTTLDVSRVLLLTTMATFLGLSVFSVWHSGTFDMLNFSVGACGILFGGASAVRVKRDCEPGA